MFLQAITLPTPLLCGPTDYGTTWHSEVTDKNKREAHVHNVQQSRMYSQWNSDKFTKWTHPIVPEIRSSQRLQNRPEDDDGFHRSRKVGLQLLPEGREQ
ncbi:unnamed protein product [Caenorhabditis brenneri]